MVFSWSMFPKIMILIDVLINLKCVIQSKAHCTASSWAASMFRKFEPIAIYISTPAEAPNCRTRFLRWLFCSSQQVFEVQFLTSVESIFFLAGNTSYTQVEFQNRPVKRYIMDASGVWSQGQDSVAGKAGCRHFLDWHDSAFTNVTRSSQYGVLWRELIHGWSRWNFIFSVFMDSVIFMMWKFALF